MGTEEAKQEEAKAANEKPKQEGEKKEEKQKEEKPREEKKEEEKPSPPPPIILFVHLHCVGCAKKIERSILKCRGVEEIETNIEKNEVTVKGLVDPQILCSLIQKKTSRNAKILSPLPPSDGASDSTTKAESPPPPGGVMATVELIVNMHCEACAQQLRKTIMKMRGVQSAETELSAKKVTVTGSMNVDKLVEYIHRRTGKIARIVPPPPKEEEKKTEQGEDKAEEKKIPAEDRKDNEAQQKKEEGEKPSDATTNATKDDPAAPAAHPMTEEMVKRMMYWSGGGYVGEEEMAKRMNMMQWIMPALVPTPVPMYVVERPPLQLPPPPQIFSDENPNACCIS